MIEWERVARAHINAMRLDVLDAFDQARGSLSAAMIARELGVSVGRVSHHVRALADLGLVVPTGERHVRGAVERFYRAN